MASPERSSKPEYRFAPGDRVLCNIGKRRLSGKVINVGVEDPEDPEQDPFAYVVKTDALQNMESNMISAPSDTDDCICRDRCFFVKREYDLAKWAAPIISKEARQPLRFGIGDKVCIRIWDREDGYENWKAGEVTSVWSKIRPKPSGTSFLEEWADAIPYKVDVEHLGLFYCHRDDHTLIRKVENAPRTLLKTMSKRMEKRKLEDGTLEVFDHVTCRRRIVKDDA